MENKPRTQQDWNFKLKPEGQQDAHCYLTFPGETWHIDSIHDIYFQVSRTLPYTTYSLVIPISKTERLTMIWPEHMQEQYAWSIALALAVKKEKKEEA